MTIPNAEMSKTTMENRGRGMRRFGDGDCVGVLARAMSGVDGAAREVGFRAVVWRGSSRGWPFLPLRSLEGFQLRLLGLRARAGDMRVFELGSGSGTSESREDSSPSSADPEERLFMEKAREDPPRA